MSTIVTLDNNNFDINNLFRFDYELLKKLIEALAKNQIGNTSRILDLEMSMAKKDVKLKKYNIH